MKHYICVNISKKNKLKPDISEIWVYYMRNGGIEMHINWESFAAYNHDARGIRFKFEDLCRQLFANENLTGNKQFRYLHANPNNHGLETEPIYDETNKRWIGFQAKFLIRM